MFLLRPLLEKIPNSDLDWKSNDNKTTNVIYDAESLINISSLHHNTYMQSTLNSAVRCFPVSSNPFPRTEHFPVCHSPYPVSPYQHFFLTFFHFFLRFFPVIFYSNFFSWKFGIFLQIFENWKMVSNVAKCANSRRNTEKFGKFSNFRNLHNSLKHC